MISPKTTPENRIAEDVLEAVCQNPFLLGQLASNLISTRDVLHWQHRYHELNADLIRFDESISTPGVAINSKGDFAINSNPNRSKFNAAFLSPAFESGVIEIKWRLEDDRMNDEMTCFGFSTSPFESNKNYEESQSMWVYRCFNGEVYSQGRKHDRSLDKAHAGSEISFLFNMDEATVSVTINEHAYGVVFSSIPSPVYPLVLFYNSQPPQRAVRLVSVSCQSNSIASSSLSSDQAEGLSTSGNVSLLIHHLSECVSTNFLFHRCYFYTHDKSILFTLQILLDRLFSSSQLLRRCGLYDDISPPATSVRLSGSLLDWCDECW